MTREQIIAEARTWVDTPYIHQGRLIHVGADCIGLVQGVVKAFGIKFEDRLDYNRFGNGPFDLNKEMGQWGRPIFLTAAKSGTVFTFYGRDKRSVQHCGFKTPLGLLHTHGMIGKVCEHGWTDFWLQRISGAFDLIGVED